jgi:small GTP-binding protein
LGLLSRLLGRSSEKQFEGNVAFIGLSFAGKTTILNRLRFDKFEEDTLRTMGLNVDNFEYKGVKFSAFDLGGQETFRMIWEPYLKTAVAVCYVIDSSTPESYMESGDVLRSVLKNIPSKAALLLLANKSDLAPKNALAAIITAFDFKSLQETADLKAINLFYISAKTGDQFSEAFDWLADVVTDTLKKNDYRKKVEIDDATKIKLKQETKIRKDISCCFF